MRYPLVKHEYAVETGVEVENAGANQHISRGVTERAQRALTAAADKISGKEVDLRPRSDRASAAVIAQFHRLIPLLIESRPLR